MRRSNKTLLQFLTTLLLVCLLHACNWPSDSGGDQTKYPQTEILQIKVQPDTVAPSDTASFTCVIKDSTDERFKFYWIIDAGEVIGAKKQDANNDQYVSEENQIKWVSPNNQNDYTFGVFVSNGSKDSVGVREGFSIAVE